MENELCTAIDIVKKYGQEHLLNFYDELNVLQKKKLLNQISLIDFDYINHLFQNLENPLAIEESRISPMAYKTKSRMSFSELAMYCSLGEDILYNNELAIITLAGGQGTRLNCKGPKGSYEIDIPPKKSLFEFTCDKLKDAYIKYKVYLPWYIMTSPSNDLQTKEFFNERNYFGYPKDRIFFFSQNTIPLIDTNGKIILDNIYSIKNVSNGNGDLFNCFASNNLPSLLLKQNIKWIFVSGIDNIILDIVDPIFIGLTIYNNSDIASKSIKKDNITSPEWVFANVDNSPALVNPTHFSTNLLYSKNADGFYNYNQMNILAHLFRIDAFIDNTKIELPYHMALKKNPYINDEGVKVVPTKPNSYKFEKFIFDSFKYAKNFTLLEVDRSQEFAPIKSFTGDATPETALNLYLNKISNYVGRLLADPTCVRSFLS